MVEKSSQGPQSSRRQLRLTTIAFIASKAESAKGIATSTSRQRTSTSPNV
jgi:hypothetical protein